MEWGERCVNWVDVLIGVMTARWEVVLLRRLSKWGWWRWEIGVGSLFVAILSTLRSKLGGEVMTLWAGPNGSAIHKVESLFKYFFFWKIKYFPRYIRRTCAPSFLFQA